ncbi:hypothetical protein ACKGJI_09900 [Sulfurospirillum sp. 1307]
MKLLRGFKKNYFSLSAILAYSVATKLHAKETSVSNLVFNNTRYGSEDEDEDLLEFELPIENLNSDKPCHCNCFFKIKTKIVTSIYHYIPRCPYYCTYFAFRRTGVHPPYISLI